MEDKKTRQIGDILANGLRKTANEIEYIQLQIGLGKLEALEQYELIKKKYASSLHNIKLSSIRNKEKLDLLKQKINILQVQLALGKAESKEAFEEQKKKISLAVHELRVAVQDNPNYSKINAFLLELAENISIQLDLLSEKTAPMRSTIRNSVNENKKRMEKIIQEFEQKIFPKKAKKTRWEVMREEFSQAYNHMKKAFA
jgi:hypothetical protein